jgi:hypothetical protein
MLPASGGGAVSFIFDNSCDVAVGCLGSTGAAPAGWVRGSQDEG